VNSPYLHEYVISSLINKTGLFSLSFIKQIMSTTCTRNHTKFLSSVMVGMLILSVEDCSFDPPSNQDTKIVICRCCWLVYFMWSSLSVRYCRSVVFSRHSYFPPSTKSTWLKHRWKWVSQFKIHKFLIFMLLAFFPGTYGKYG